jgi:hypothetical protein
VISQSTLFAALLNNCVLYNPDTKQRVAMADSGNACVLVSADNRILHTSNHDPIAITLSLLNVHQEWMIDLTNVSNDLSNNRTGYIMADDETCYTITPYTQNFTFPPLPYTNNSWLVRDRDGIFVTMVDQSVTLLEILILLNGITGARFTQYQHFMCPNIIIHKKCI